MHTKRTRTAQSTFFAHHEEEFNLHIGYELVRDRRDHGLRTHREEIAFTAPPKIQSQSKIFRYGQSIFSLPHRPNFSDNFDLCLHWVSVVREYLYKKKFASTCNSANF